MSAAPQTISSASSAYDVIPGVGGVTYRLGWRKLGWRRWTLLGRALLGLVWAIGIEATGFHNWFWGFHAIAAVVAVWSILPLMLPSRGEISVDPRRVTWREVGWMKRQEESVGREQIVRLRVDAVENYRSAAKKWMWVHAGDALLVAELASGEEAPLVLGYPHAVVMQVAEVLRRALGQESGGAPVNTPGRAAELVDLSGVPLAARDVLHPPLNCDVIMHETGALKTFLYVRHTRSAGASRFITVLVAMLLIAVAPALTLLSLMHINGRWPPGTLVVGGLEVLWLGLMVFVLRRLWRTMAIVVTPEHLTFAWRGWLGGWERSWARASIAGIKTREDVDGKVRLVVIPRHGTSVALVTGDGLTWRWVATELRRALGVGIG